ncbi:MAG: acylphosphatase [bacterium]
MKRYHCIIKGRVQGVGFRYFSREQAVKLGLNGWVRNLYDGSVVLEVQGEENYVEEFLKRIKQGPGFGYVTDMDINNIPVLEAENDFRITY